MAAQSMYKNDKTLLEYAYMYDFRAIVQEELVTFGAPVTIMGYPGKDGETGITAMLSQEMAIMAKAKNPDGAWAFLKGFITYIDPNSKGDVTSRGNYSILQADLEKLAELALDRPYYLDYETREKVYYDNTAYVDNQEIPIPNNTAEDNAKIMEMIANISSVQRSENELQTIIEDDIKAFFTGQKSAEETAAIIQNRASTYVAESR
jgi:ABC-type glycerol-3-phosphate transport system substrate-binding protein